MKFRKIQAYVSIIVFAFSVPSEADELYPFRVAFENVPGVDHLVAGDIARGIQVLELDLLTGTSNEGYVLATLCGAYVLNQELAKAEETCADAVERFPGNTVFNNRGVLRAFRGDLSGARRDFDRARPSSMEAYMKLLGTRDIGLVATGNHELLRDISARHSTKDIQSSYTSIEHAPDEVLEE